MSWSATKACSRATPGDDDRWDAAASILRMGVREAICVPMQGRYDVVGVIYIDTSISPQRIVQQGSANKFTEEHLKLMIAIAHQAALAVEDTQLLLGDGAGRTAGGRRTDDRHAVAPHQEHPARHPRRQLFDRDGPGASTTKEVVGKGWDIVEKNQERISSLVMDMLTFSKEREPDFTAADLNAVVGDVIELMRSRAEELKVELRFEPDASIPTLTFDTEGIHRAALNIVTNALDACDERENGCVTIATKRLADEGLVQSSSPTTAAASRRKLAADLHPFFSSKGARGTGLGLAVSQKILKEHGGRILVESRLGEGSRFTLEFPAMPAEEASGQRMTEPRLRDDTTQSDDEDIEAGEQDDITEPKQQFPV